MRGHNFGWKAFWDSNQDWPCRNLRLAVVFRHSDETAMPRLCVLHPGIRLTTEETSTERKKSTGMDEPSHGPAALDLRE
jgi:hypothetical protein